MIERYDERLLNEWMEGWIDAHVTPENFKEVIPKLREAIPLLVSLFLSMNAAGASPKTLRLVTPDGIDARGGGVSEVQGWPKGKPASSVSFHPRLPRSSTPEGGA